MDEKAALLIKQLSLNNGNLLSISGTILGNSLLPRRVDFLKKGSFSKDWQERLRSVLIFGETLFPDQIADDFRRDIPSALKAVMSA